ncbi:disease resistance protein [Striga asiatica]|uniref:Disease resistance protein n=1 Tax=Striga asiatica TaxID=4170 RepID=A0A5A7NY80_STRAF|nr:disease resistance protein [Striga asiatica]
MALKVECPDNDPGTLTIMIHLPFPSFFRSAYLYTRDQSQPKKHTLWQATTDFTDGQASLNNIVHLPRIASLPKFPNLFGIDEDDEYDWPNHAQNSLNYWLN